MDAQHYQEQAGRTEAMVTGIKNDKAIRLLHAQIGLTTEVGEFANSIKRYVYYNKPLDVANLQEEIGDIMWYIALACNTIGTSLGAVMADNIEKLRKRYPDQYSDELAEKRLDKK